MLNLPSITRFARIPTCQNFRVILQLQGSKDLKTQLPVNAQDSQSSRGIQWTSESQYLQICPAINQLMPEENNLNTTFLTHLFIHEVGGKTKRKLKKINENKNLRFL